MFGGKPLVKGTRIGIVVPNVAPKGRRRLTGSRRRLATPHISARPLGTVAPETHATLQARFPLIWRLQTADLTQAGDQAQAGLKTPANFDPEVADVDSIVARARRHEESAWRTANTGSNPCVQKRLMCSAGVSPAGVRARSPVAWMAGRRETECPEAHRQRHPRDGERVAGP